MSKYPLIEETPGPEVGSTPLPIPADRTKDFFSPAFISGHQRGTKDAIEVMRVELLRLLPEKDIVERFVKLVQSRLVTPGS